MPEQKFHRDSLNSQGIPTGMLLMPSRGLCSGTGACVVPLLCGLFHSNSPLDLREGKVGVGVLPLTEIAEEIGVVPRCLPGAPSIGLGSICTPGALRGDGGFASTRSGRGGVVDSFSSFIDLPIGPYAEAKEGFAFHWLDGEEVLGGRRFR